MKHRIVLAVICLLPVLSMAQSVVVHEQVNFPEQIPAGGYSGITWLGEDRYAVVTDNAAHDGFFVFRIQIDSLGCIVDVSDEGFRGNDDKGHDNEGVAWCPARGTVFISGETDNQVRELTLEGKATGKTLRLPKWLTKGASAKYGLEALSYNAQTHRFWTVSESTLQGDGPQATPQNGAANRLRLMAFNDDLAPVGQYYYEMDKPDGAREGVLCGTVKDWLYRAVQDLPGNTPSQGPTQWESVAERQKTLGEAVGGRMVDGHWTAHLLSRQL